MSWTRRTLTIVGLTVAATALLVGAGAAIAAGSSGSDDELTRVADGIRRHSAVATAVAKELDTTVAKLDAAIASAATKRIDAAEKAGTLSAADADLLRQEIASEDHLAMRIAQAADVAAALGTTEAKLNAAYAKVQKANALARVDQAEKDQLITKKVADEMRTRIEAATFPGFAGGAGGGRHGGFGHGGPGVFGHHGGFGDGGFGPPAGGMFDGGAAPSGGSTSEVPATVV